ncbi:SGNH/GDSL hydrolase family protein [Bosea caraganae]|uniref:SGNH/GDSL hydrolase family protein n=1 Tax=Bosea caraganae TaxID=2763117 RepID=A0A370LBZ1_9HYPH|nr:GDSL-type esterase/lipase family protein [Bosea caraganae]RDJ27479.1 SGNH/GDSL hydrolase family protein [Bosea caraganae]RDJ29494.1 SGNH/GDSL hydrolase family protein [Bosea caraganae]
MTLALSADQRCRAGAADHPFQPSLSAAKKALQETGKLTIVALGSSTTAGSGASQAERSYPAVLEAELKRRLPDRDIKVVNKGIGGQSAYDMLLRIDADVIAEKPTIVIWQTVVNDAIRDVGEEKLAKILKKGIRKVENAGIDMVLMDLQWLPREDRYPKYEEYRAVLAKTAGELNVSVFPRHAMMKSWAKSNKFTEEELVGMDGLHMVDASYRCLAIRIADGLVSGLTGAKLDLAEGPKPTN